MEMLPPALRNNVGIGAAEDEEISTTCVGASLGSGIMNRLAVRRRLFADESPENSPPPDAQFQSQVTDMFVKEKKRMLDKWGYDADSDSPSTSTSSNFEYMAMRLSEVPKFYTKVHPSRPQKPKDRMKDFVVASFPITIPPVLVSSEISEPAAPTDVTATGSVIIGASPKVTPPKPKGKKKANTKSAPISGQSLLTRYYPTKRHASMEPPMEAKKRASDEATSSSQGEPSSIRP